MAPDSQGAPRPPAAKSLASLPLPVLLLEGAGALMLVVAWIAFNDVLPLPDWLQGKTAARLLIAAAVCCMLPAAIIMMWRTAQIIAPQLFAASTPKKERDKHDADH